MLFSQIKFDMSKCSSNIRNHLLYMQRRVDWEGRRARKKIMRQG